MLSRSRCSSNSILDFDNKSMKGTKNFGKFLEDISKGVRFYKATALQPRYLLKRALLLKKILFMLNSNNPYTVYKSNSRGVFRTQSHIYEGAFLQRKPSVIFSKTLYPMLDLVLNLLWAPKDFSRNVNTWQIRHL